MEVRRQPERHLVFLAQRHVGHLVLVGSRGDHHRAVYTGAADAAGECAVDLQVANAGVDDGVFGAGEAGAGAVLGEAEQLLSRLVRGLVVRRHCTIRHDQLQGAPRLRSTRSTFPLSSSTHDQSHGHKGGSGETSSIPNAALAMSSAHHVPLRPSPPTAARESNSQRPPPYDRSDLSSTVLMYPLPVHIVSFPDRGSIPVLFESRDPSPPPSSPCINHLIVVIKPILIKGGLLGGETQLPAIAVSAVFPVVLPFVIRVAMEKVGDAREFAGALRRTVCSVELAMG